MATNAVWGWGGIRFVYDGSDVEFSTAFNRQYFQDEKVRNRRIDGKFIEHFTGWRPVIDAQIFNIDSGDDAKFITLLNIISQAKADGEPITVYPRYDSLDAGSQWSGSFLLDSDIDIPDLEQRVSIGQQLDIRFIGETLLSTLPTNVSDQETVWLAWSEDAGDVLIYDSTTADTYIIAI